MSKKSSKLAMDTYWEAERNIELDTSLSLVKILEKGASKIRPDEFWRKVSESAPKEKKLC